MAYSPPLSGYKGAFYLADYGGTPVEIANIRSWTVDVTAGEADVSGMGEAWSRAVGTQKKWTASVEGAWNYSGTSGMDELWANLSDKVDVRFYVDEANTHYFSGTATVVGLSPSASVDSAVTFSSNLSGVGALSYNTS